MKISAESKIPADIFKVAVLYIFAYIVCNSLYLFAVICHDSGVFCREVCSKDILRVNRICVFARFHYLGFDAVYRYLHL